MLHDLQKNDVTNEQFEAIAQLLRLQENKSQDAARLVLVSGVSQADAARQVGITAAGVSAVVTRVNRGMHLAKVAMGNAVGGQNVTVSATKGGILINVQFQDLEDDPEMQQFQAEQAIADARIEGFVPDAEFTANFAAVEAGEITEEEYFERVKRKAQRIEDAAAKRRVDGSAQ